MTTISIGPPCLPPGTIEDLLAKLKETPLSRLADLEFYHENITLLPGKAGEFEGCENVAQFNGNFLFESYGFGIYTDDQELIATLKTAIDEHLASPLYQASIDGSYDQYKEFCNAYEAHHEKQLILDEYPIGHRLHNQTWECPNPKLPPKPKMKQWLFEMDKIDFATWRDGVLPPP